jgi:hypothetical protein
VTIDIAMRPSPSGKASAARTWHKESKRRVSYAKKAIRDNQTKKPQ